MSLLVGRLVEAVGGLRVRPEVCGAAEGGLAWEALELAAAREKSVKAVGRLFILFTRGLLGLLFVAVAFSGEVLDVDVGVVVRGQRARA